MDQPLPSTSGDKIAELQNKGFCVLKAHFAQSVIQSCREAFWPILLEYLQINRDKPNRGDSRHFVAMPFEPPCFAPEFFFNTGLLRLIHGAMDDRVVADQWGCDAPLRGSTHQNFHVDYQRPLFPESPDLPLQFYMLVVSFGLMDITPEHGPIEIAPGTHNMPRAEAVRSVQDGEIEAQPVTLDCGDVLIRHPWALHRGTPNVTETPRALISIRYVRRWYADRSRDVNTIPLGVWQSLSPDQQSMMRFPIADSLNSSQELRQIRASVAGLLPQSLIAGAKKQKDNGHEYARPESEGMEFPPVGRIGST